MLVPASASNPLSVTLHCRLPLAEAGLAWQGASNIEAVMIIRIGFWGPLYYNYNKEPPKPYSNY